MTGEYPFLVSPGNRVYLSANLGSSLDDVKRVDMYSRGICLNAINK